MARPLKPQTDFAARLIEARGSLDRDEFATLLGVPKTTLASWEQGAKIPPLDKIRAIRQQAGVSLDWLIAGEGEMRPTQEVILPAPAPASAPAHLRSFNRALMHALIEMYYEEAIEMKSTLTPSELADRVLAMYERSVDDIGAIADPASKVA